MSKDQKDFYPPDHPATIRILNQVLPGKRVRDFSLHFPMEGPATIKAEIILQEQDAEELATVCEEHGLQTKVNK